MYLRWGWGVKAFVHRLHTTSCYVDHVYTLSSLISRWDSLAIVLFSGEVWRPQTHLHCLTTPFGLVLQTFAMKSKIHASDCNTATTLIQTCRLQTRRLTFLFQSAAIFRNRSIWREPCQGSNISPVKMASDGLSNYFPLNYLLAILSCGSHESTTMKKQP